MELIDYDSEIRNLEEEIIKFLLKSQLFIGGKNSTALILSYFITRKSLTQAKIRKLTHLAPGTISQEINSLLDQGIIEEKCRTSGGEKLYLMESITEGFSKSYINSLNYYRKYRDRFTEILKDLENHKEELKDEDGFQQIFNLVEIFLRMFPVIEKLITLLKSAQK